MHTIRIIGGDLKGKTIPFLNARFDDAEITPQKVKEALFSIIGAGLSGSSFLDLFGGSGQIGFEALSRGADPVVINEKDRKRFFFIKSFAQGLERGDGLVILNFHSSSAVKYLKKKGMAFDYIFIDQPYIKVKGEAEKYRSIVLELDKGMVLKKEGRIIIQHFSGNLMDEKIGRFALDYTRKYGSTSLSFYDPIMNEI